jgi:hypothetical protein
MSRETVRDAATEKLGPEGERGKEAGTGGSGEDRRGLRRERSFDDVEFFEATRFLNSLRTIPKRSTKEGWKNWDEVQNKSRFLYILSLRERKDI